MSIFKKFGRKAGLSENEERSARSFLLRSWPALKNSFSGRCFVIGNGPSLKDHDLRALKNDVIFGVNRGYLAVSHGLPKPNFYVCSDGKTYRAYSEEIRKADVGLRFYRSTVLNKREYRRAPDREFAIPFEMLEDELICEGHFSTDLSKGASRGETVVLDAIQIAVHMGFREIYVIGVDLTAPTTGSSHFFGTGAYEQSRLGKMSVDNVVKAFAVARERIEALGGNLKNAGIGGNLTTLDRVQYTDLF